MSFLKKIFLVVIVITLMIVAGETGYIVALKSIETNVNRSANTVCVNTDRNLVNSLNSQLGLFDNIVTLLTLVRHQESFTKGSINSVFDGKVEYSQLIDNSKTLLLNIVANDAPSEKSSYVFKVEDVHLKDSQGKSMGVQDLKPNDKITIEALFDIKQLKYTVTIIKK